MAVAIDRRPVWVILLSKSLRPIIFLSIAWIALFILRMPTPTGLTLEGQRAIAVFVVCVVLWVSGIIPLAITSLLAVVLLPSFGILESGQAFSLFGNQAVFFILGAFILASALMVSGLSSRIALLVLRRFGHTPFSLVASIFLLCGSMSFVMSEHAVAAMMFPIVLEIVRGLNLRPIESQYGKALFLAMAWGCIIGGVGTFLGGARAPLAMGILHQTTGANIGFFEWIISVLPAVLILFVVALYILKRFYVIDITSIEQAREVLENRIKEKGKMSMKEKLIGIIMSLTIICWILFGHNWGLATIAIISVVLIFMLKLIKWRDVEEYVNWGIILMYGGAIALGFALEKSGAAAWTAKVSIGQWVNHPAGLIAVISLLSILLTEAMSNSAVIAILMPVGISLAKGFGIDPKLITYSIAVPAGLAYCLPISTPATAIAYSSGFVNLRDMLIPGIALGLISWIIFNFMANLYWPLLGYSF